MVTAVLIVSHSIVCKVQQEFEDIGLAGTVEHGEPAIQDIQSYEEKLKYQLLNLHRS